MVLSDQSLKIIRSAFGITLRRFQGIESIEEGDGVGHKLLQILCLLEDSIQKVFKFSARFNRMAGERNQGLSHYLHQSLAVGL